jgi:hypothetical protein
MKLIVDITTNPGNIVYTKTVSGNAFHLICDFFSDLGFQNINYSLPKCELRKEVCIYRRYFNNTPEIVAIALTHGEHFIALTGDLEFETGIKFTEYSSALFPGTI